LFLQTIFHIYLAFFFVSMPKEILGGLDGDKPARDAIEAQDREIAERSGQPMPRIKSIKRTS
jgi:hypothetical protein